MRVFKNDLARVTDCRRRRTEPGLGLGSPAAAGLGMLLVVIGAATGSVRAAREGRFREVVARHLAEASVCITGEELLESGLLGPGEPHPSLHNRVGDYVLLARDGYAFRVTPPLTKARVHKGNHGGLSSDEMYVPLYALRL